MMKYSYIKNVSPGIGGSLDAQTVVANIPGEARRESQLSDANCCCVWAANCSCWPQEQFAKVHVELNAHLYYGAAEAQSCCVDCEWLWDVGISDYCIIHDSYPSVPFSIFQLFIRYRLVQPMTTTNSVQAMSKIDMGITSMMCAYLPKSTHPSMILLVDHQQWVGCGPWGDFGRSDSSMAGSLNIIAAILRRVVLSANGLASVVHYPWWNRSTILQVYSVLCVFPPSPRATCSAMVGSNFPNYIG